MALVMMGMAIQATITAVLVYLGIITMSPGQQLIAAVMFCVLAFINIKLEGG
jgi:hypothetical protein